MTDDGELYEERVFREHAEARDRLERALARLAAGLSVEDVAAGMDRFARYLEVQIAEDETALSEHAAYEAGYGPDVPTSRTTRMQDRSGLELALMLLTGER